MKRLFALVGLAAVVTGTAVAAPSESGVAPCDKAMVGDGSADWRGESLVAGPVGVLPRPLRQMSPTKRGLVTKMPMLVEGREPETVTVSVPPTLRKRAFLYFGGDSSFPHDHGYGEIEFQLCGNKPRTIWPGGIRVKGEGPVHLNVFSEGRAEPFVLPLGKPKPYRRTAQ
ncbi:MAG TPA: hypothetical protein VFI03_09075 [Solirubrobacterales bacterium]|nr:hypothetical protein [Solirubrobacterales bacterium]